ncbi:UNVERIFIED_CONTAM: hypothetical protein GTU68_066941 [Idotea baltica]|nr:hypothetical protein [Idotea baltica]
MVGVCFESSCRQCYSPWKIRKPHRRNFKKSTF